MSLQTSHRHLLLAICLTLMGLGYQPAYGQSLVNQSVHLGAGSSHFSTEGPFNGCGVLLNAGWQKTLKQQTLRFSPDLTAAFYNNDCTESPNRADYTALTGRAILNFDFIQSRQFAAFIGGGPVFNYTFGEFIPAINPNNPLPDPLLQAETQFHPGMAINVGLRFLPRNGRLGFEMLPVNVQFDFSDYAELVFFARLFYSLDVRRNPKEERR